MIPLPYNTEAPFTQELIERFNRYTHFPKSLEKENASFAEESRKEREAAMQTIKRAGIEAPLPEIERALERVRRTRYEAFLASVRSREMAPPWSVVGPANYHKHARPERANRITERAMENLAKARALLTRDLERLFPSAVIRSDEPGAAGRLQANIDAASKLQEAMKTANKIIRGAGQSPEQKVARLKAECGFDELRAITLLKPDFAGRNGFPDYKLANNSANIRRMQLRLVGLKREAVRPSAVIPFAGGRIEDDPIAGRIRVFHDEKPARVIIEKLKANGFHWAFQTRCWQRLRNQAARTAAAEAVGVVWPPNPTAASEAPPPTVATVAASPSAGAHLGLAP